MPKRPLRVLVLSDLHVGSTVGLWPEEHPVEGGGLASANKYQRWLLACWREMEAEAKALKPDVLVVNGDPLQGSNHRDGQLITTQMSVQRSACGALLAGVCKASKRRYFIRGTEWHDGKASDDVEDLAKSLHAEPDPDSGQYTRWELYLDLGGPVVHFAHHVGVSSVPWYEATVPLRDTLMQLAELWRFYGAQAPNVRCVVRSHRHRFIHVNAPPDLQVFVTPSWQLKTAFAYKKASGMLPQIGYVLVEWDGRDIVVKPRIYQLPGLRVESL